MNQSLYLIAGLGLTGASIARYLTKRNKQFVFFDTRHTVDGVELLRSQFPDADVFFNSLPAELYGRLHQVIISPGVALDSPVIKKIQHLNIPLVSDIDCLVQAIEQPVIAITGTNGKSTVTTLVGQMAELAGLNPAVGGNIGLPVLDLLDDSKAYDVWVLELSSFQLETTQSLAALGATILNISPDHLDRHGSIGNYITAKQKIYRNVTYAIYNRDDQLTLPMTDLIASEFISFGLSAPKQGEWGVVNRRNVSYLAFGRDCLLDVRCLALKGKHNWQNALAACALASTLGIQHSVMTQVLSSFRGLAHRCQWVRTLDGVCWINDSKGTNVGATNSAIEGIGSTIKGNIILIAGGLGKGADFRLLKEQVNNYISDIILIGQDAPNIADALKGAAAIEQTASLQQAILSAKHKAFPGDVVLFSPACASQDMFRDFNHRGDVFTQLVGEL